MVAMSIRTRASSFSLHSRWELQAKGSELLADSSRSRWSELASPPCMHFNPTSTLLSSTKAIVLTFNTLYFLQGLPRWFSGKESTCQGQRLRRCVFDPWVGKIPWRRKWQPTPVFLPGEFHGQRSLVVYRGSIMFWGLQNHCRW